MPTTTGSGQILMLPGDTPAPQPAPSQNITGSVAQVAAAKTANDQAAHAAAFKNLGAGQKGASRKRKGRGRMRGGNTQFVKPSTLPSAGSIPGVTPTNVSRDLSNTAAQLKADAAYDGLANKNPYLVGGFLLRGSEEMYPASGTQEDTKRTRKTKKKHGRRHKRTHRRNRSRTHPVRRRRSRRV